MTTEHEVFSDEYVDSRTKQYKQAKALGTVFAVGFGVLTIAVGLAGMVMDHSLNELHFLILAFVSIGIVANARGRHDTLLENKRLWDRTSS